MSNAIPKVFKSDLLRTRHRSSTSMPQQLCLFYGTLKRRNIQMSIVKEVESIFPAETSIPQNALSGLPV